MAASQFSLRILHIWSVSSCLFKKYFLTPIFDWCAGNSLENMTKEKCKVTPQEEAELKQEKQGPIYRTNFVGNGKRKPWSNVLRREIQG